MLYSASTTQPYVGCWVLLITSVIFIIIPLGVWLSTTLGPEILDTPIDRNAQVSALPEREFDGVSCIKNTLIPYNSWRGRRKGFLCASK